VPKKSTTFKIPFAWVTPKEYSDQTGMWIEDVKRLCNEGKIPCEKSPGGYYRIKVFKDESVSREEFEKIKQELEKYKTIVETTKATLNLVWKKVKTNEKEIKESIYTRNDWFRINAIRSRRVCSNIKRICIKNFRVERREIRWKQL